LNKRMSVKKVVLKRQLLTLFKYKLKKNDINTHFNIHFSTKNLLVKIHMSPPNIYATHMI